MSWTDWLPAIGGLLGGLGGDEPAGETTTTSAPWGPQQPYILDLLRNAQRTSRYGGELTPDQIAAQEEMGRWASGENQNPMLGVDNPYLQAVIDKSSSDFMSNWQPAVNRANAASGSFGNSGVAEAYGKAGSEGLSNSIMNTRYQDFNAQRGLYENDANRRISATGQFQNQANYEQQLPWNNIRNYGQAVAGNYGGTQSSPYFTNTGANVLGGIGAGSWLSNQINRPPT